MGKKQRAVYGNMPKTAFFAPDSGHYDAFLRWNPVHLCHSDSFDPHRIGRAAARPRGRPEGAERPTALFYE